MTTRFQNLTVSQAESVARQQGVDISDLLAERDRLDRTIAERLAHATCCSSSGSNRRDPPANGEYREPHHRSGKRSRSFTAAHSVDNNDSSALRLLLQDCSVTQLHAIAEEKSVDFSHVLEKSEMIDQILDSWP